MSGSAAASICSLNPDVQRQGAELAHVIEVECDRLEPMLARPGDPGHGIAISELAETVGIDIAYGGSCTGGKREDLLHYHAVLEWATQRGMRVAPGTRFFLQFGSQDVRDYCVQSGMLDVF